VDQNSNTIFGPLLGSLAGVLFLSLSAATGEEMLFRGALQPRLGLLLVAVLFTAFHDQYGFSFILLGIFILALGLGWLRNSMNLWVGIVAHAWYDFLSSLSFDPLIALGIGAVGLALCLLLLNSHSERLFAPQTSNFGWQQI
jgi:membrane protease YdiL (CAAX protease family)